MNQADLDHLQSWKERSERVTETLSPVPAQCLAATLNLANTIEESSSLPPLWHWLYFPDRTASRDLGPDGSPRSKTLRPPIPLEQVMWAGADFDFIKPLAFGRPVQKTSQVSDISLKKGARGPMVFVTVESRFEQDGELAFTENNRAVFLGAATGAAAPGPLKPPLADRQMQWPVDEVSLFRFSALTFNSHRIHYDLPYATQVGGYPGLVVHGPLQALVLAETFRQWHPGKSVRRAEFRAKSSLFCGEPIRVCARHPEEGRHALWTQASNGSVAMDCILTSEG